MTARRARRGALALTLTAALGTAAIVGVATAAKAPATRNLSASGTKLAFSKTKLTAPKGRVQLVLTNRSPLDHNVSIRGKGLTTRKGKVVGRNGVSRVTATLAPGKYTYFCAVGGHEAAGMKGTLTVPRPRR
jgi:plastocyanin